MKKLYHIAILLADKNLPALYHDKQTLPILFSKFFSSAHCQITFFDILEQEYPDNPSAFDVCIISGSKHSVLKREPWADTLYNFIIRKEYNKLIGICYGHQMIALALGGTVERIGWHVGVSRVKFTNPNITEFDARFNHEDQVVTLPANAKQLASSPYCTNAVFQIDSNILSMQFHPEFTQPYHSKLIQERYIHKLNPEQLKYARETINLADNKEKLLNLILTFA